MAERSTTDALLDLINPLPKQAEAAPWPEVVKFLKGLAPGAWARLGSEDLRALEYLTEGFTPVRGSKLGLSSKNYPLWDLSGEAFLSSPTEYPSLGNSGTIKMLPSRFYWMGTPRTDPAMVYSHEAGHVLGGPTHGFTDARYDLGNRHTGRPPTPAAGVMEGFADAVSHGLLGRYGQKAVYTHWPTKFKAAPWEARGPYEQAGYFGEEVGRAIRGGERVQQQSVIDQLIDLVNRWR